MDEEAISSEDAAQYHGIVSRHGRMKRTGELRFRLLKNDGTAYIRTEASDTGGWQKSHWHNRVLETYIVQTGWIGYAELMDGIPVFRIYAAGERFTTSPFVIHNVYMPAKAVIHTVKHGDGIGEKRLEDNRTDQFTALTEKIDEKELRSLAKRNNGSSTQPPISFSYSDAYRHFDNLIWQASAWSSGLFTLALAGMTQVTTTNPLMAATGLDYVHILATFSAMFGFFILVISHALYRFRWHQCATKNYRPRKQLLSPQAGLQAMVNLQAATLISVSFALSGWAHWEIAVVMFLFFAIIETYQETKIADAHRASVGPRETRS
ncbi:MAG: hypothetical protein ACTHJR_18630 [Sphingomonas sp.]|uniref:hypothetical protein n=1 Tax=Sphingomonas sp. TaxID=28214 RepID=UPI003F7EE4DA